MKYYNIQSANEIYHIRNSFVSKPPSAPKRHEKKRSEQTREWTERPITTNLFLLKIATDLKKSLSNNIMIIVMIICSDNHHYYHKWQQTTDAST